MRLIGQSLFGVYRDDCEGIHPDVINEYYGVHGAPARRHPHQSGAGHPADEEGSDDDNITGYVADQQQQHVHHEAIRVPSHRNPFGDVEKEVQFFNVLHKVITEGITPDHIGLTPEEWGSDHYPAYETIRVGRCGSKELHISLAEPIWYYRACLWCQALMLLSCFFFQIPCSHCVYIVAMTLP